MYKATIPQVTLSNIVQCYKKGNKNIKGKCISKSMQR